MKKICFITGSRADYGLIKPVLDAVKKSKFKLQLVVVASHLEPKFGLTINEIKNDGFKVDATVNMSLQNDSAECTVKSMGLELTELAKIYNKLRPDLIFITGDRYEMLAAAAAALIFRIPIAHLYGGDVTEGAFDDSIRHAISKMSALHFVSNAESKKRIIQMGESPKSVFNVGSPSLDKIKTLKKLTKNELEKQLNITFRKHNILVTFHPETLAKQNAESQIAQALEAISTLDKNHLVIFTMPNADPDGEKIRQAIAKYIKKNENAVAFESLGYHKYFSILEFVDMVVGNSSSGLYEVPSYKIPTINIGNRQKGRLKASSVIDVKCFKKDIQLAIAKAKKLNCSNAKNPYGEGNSAKKILKNLENIADFNQLIYKKFYDVYNS